jgi:hypothetical protein
LSCFLLTGNYQAGREYHCNPAEADAKGINKVRKRNGPLSVEGERWAPHMIDWVNQDTPMNNADKKTQ